VAFQTVVRRFVLAAVLILFGCATGPQQYLKSGFIPPKILAVLPLNNHTTDLDGPQAVRFWMDYRLKEKKGYYTLSLEQIDKALMDIGITDGGQLASVTPQALGQKLGADAILYGELLEFDYQTTGFLNIRKVRARFKMVDAQTGETLWEGEGLGANSEGAVSVSGAVRAGIKQIGTQLAERALNSPLRTEIWDMIWNAVEYLPKAR